MTKTTKLPKKLHKNLSAQQVTRLSMFVLFTRPRLTAKLQRFSFEDQDRTAKFCGLGMKTKTEPQNFAVLI